MPEIDDTSRDGSAATRAAVLEHLAAFNAHDTARLLAGLADTVRWTTGTDRFTGTAALREVFDDWLWSLDPSLQVTSLVADGDRAAAELVEQLTVDGQRRTFAIATFFELAHGLIVAATVYREGNADVT